MWRKIQLIHWVVFIIKQHIDNICIKDINWLAGSDMQWQWKSLEWQPEDFVVMSKYSQWRMTPRNWNEHYAGMTWEYYNSLYLLTSQCVVIWTPLSSRKKKNKTGLAILSNKDLSSTENGTLSISLKLHQLGTLTSLIYNVCV